MGINWNKRNFYLALIVGIVSVTIGVVSLIIFHTPQTIINSNNQLGGITAGNINMFNPTINNQINNASSPPRKINDEVIAELDKVLPKNKTSRIHITYLINDQEAYQFANQIETYLNNQGWSSTFNAAMYEPPFSGAQATLESSGDLEIRVSSNK